jgi:predicted alpha/beta hydrolase family esterase
MKEAIIVHGSPDRAEYFAPEFPSPSAFHWFPWLQKQFQMAGVLAQVPSMPAPYDAKYSEWEELFSRLVSPRLEYAVGHSSGGGFLIKYMQAHRLPLKKLVLVAPWLDPDGEFGQEWRTELDPRALDSAAETHLFISDDDDAAELDSANRLLAAYPKIIEHRFTDRGHFVGMPAFPELWDIIK